MKKIKVYPCANGSLCDASYDPKDNTIVLFQNCLAIGHIKLDEIKTKTTQLIKKNADIRGYTSSFECSECGRYLYMPYQSRSIDYSYCPYCGREIDDD